MTTVYSSSLLFYSLSTQFFFVFYLQEGLDRKESLAGINKSNVFGLGVVENWFVGFSLLLSLLGRTTETIAHLMQYKPLNMTCHFNPGKLRSWVKLRRKEHSVCARLRWRKLKNDRKYMGGNESDDLAKCVFLVVMQNSRCWHLTLNFFTQWSIFFTSLHNRVEKRT